MSEEVKNSEEKRDKRLDNLIPWKEGECPNPGGRPLGQKNYATLYREALIKIATLNDKEPSEIELEIISNGLLNARKGDYRFYKDVLDRLLGQATNKVEHSGEIKTTENNFDLQELANKLYELDEANFRGDKPDGK